MNLRYNAAEQRFEAEFHDFAGDLAAVKEAGFRTDGPPLWVWHTTKIPILNKLREKPPASNLTITPEALEIYKTLAQLEAKNAEVRKQLAEVHKKAKKERKQKDLEKSANEVGLGALTEEKWWIDVEDLPPAAPWVSKHVIVDVPHLTCFSCGAPVYFYEKQDPPTCLWCLKESEKELDKLFDL